MRSCSSRPSSPSWPRPPKMPDITYADALAALQGALKFGINPSLSGITELCEQLGRPQDAYAVVQVAGTNGKSSTSRYAAALLRGEGLHTALYTSPELERYPERMEIDGHVVSDELFAEAVGAALRVAEVLRPDAQGSEAGFTEFELLTAAALWLFREQGVECAVLEVGLGGRWDATSVASPAVAVVTGVGLDHTAILGDTLEAIAVEKAAIIRSGSSAVLGPGTAGLEPIFMRQADEVGADVSVVREAGESAGAAVSFSVTVAPLSPLDCTEFEVVSRGRRYECLSVHAPAYQVGNVATAIAAVETLLDRELGVEQMRRSLLGVSLPGRFEIVSHDPVVVVDGSHNPQACAVLADAVRAAWPVAQERPVFVIGVLADKDAEGIVRALVPAARGFIVTQPSTPRALDAGALAAVVKDATGVEPDVQADLASAIECARQTGYPIVVTGSLTTAGQARTLVGNAWQSDTSATGPSDGGG